MTALLLLGLVLTGLAGGFVGYLVATRHRTKPRSWTDTSYDPYAVYEEREERHR